MVRVYLDWNIFSYLKNYKEEREPFISLNRNLLKNADKILIPYTSAHLTDLIESYNKSDQGRTETLADLKYLEELTHNLCILYDYKDQKTYPDKYNIHEYFEELLRSETLMSGGIDNLFSTSDDSHVGKLFQSMLDMFKEIPSGIDPGTFDNIPPKFAALKNLFPSSERNSYYDLLKHSFNLLSDYNNDPKTYKSIRNASLEQLRLTHDYKKSNKPLDEISNNLKRSALKKSFKEFADETIKNSLKDKEASRFDVFTNYYILLDYFGYYKDAQFKNLIQDSFHAYYGAHCDFFVTDDDNTYNKAKVIYDCFNIETIVCKSHEFNSKFYGKVILNSSNEKRLFEIIADIIRTSFVITDQRDNHFNPVDIYKTNHYVLNYFNRLQVTHNIDGTNSIHLYKNNKNYSSFFFFKEVESIVNRLTRELGPDRNNRASYIPEIENTELIERRWTGRNWPVGKSNIELDMKESPFGLTLSVDVIL